MFINRNHILLILLTFAVVESIVLTPPPRSSDGTKSSGCLKSLKAFYPWVNATRHSRGTQNLLQLANSPNIGPFDHEFLQVPNLILNPKGFGMPTTSSRKEQHEAITWFRRDKNVAWSFQPNVEGHRPEAFLHKSVAWWFSYCKAKGSLKMKSERRRLLRLKAASIRFHTFRFLIRIVYRQFFNNVQSRNRTLAKHTGSVGCITCLSAVPAPGVPDGDKGERGDATTFCHWAGGPKQYTGWCLADKKW